MIHHVDALSENFSGFGSFLHSSEIFIEFLKMLINISILILSGQVDPEIKDSALILVFESLMKTSFNSPDNLTLLGEVSVVPNSVGFPSFLGNLLVVAAHLQ